MKLRQFPDPGERVETGPVQFGDDWPGVFIRGDNAMALALYLEQFVAAADNYCPGENAIARANVERHIAFLRSCLTGAADTTSEGVK